MRRPYYALVAAIAIYTCSCAGPNDSLIRRFHGDYSIGDAPSSIKERPALQEIIDQQLSRDRGVTQEIRLMIQVMGEEESDSRLYRQFRAYGPPTQK